MEQTERSQLSSLSTQKRLAFGENHTEKSTHRKYSTLDIRCKK